MGLRWSSSAGSNLFIFDRLWQNSGIVVTQTTAQTINSVAWPSRDVNGSSNGRGVYVAIEASATNGNLANISNTTISYTNQDGVAGRLGLFSAGALWPATASIGTLVPFSLQDGDTGIRSVQDLTLGTSYVSGVIHLVAFRPIAVNWDRGGQAGLENGPGDAIGICMPRLFSGSVPWLVQLPLGTGGMDCAGELYFTEG
jgi:hypothetical protein